MDELHDDINRLLRAARAVEADDFPGVPHDEAVARGRALAAASRAPYAVVGYYGLGFLPLALDYLPEVRTVCDDFTRVAGGVPLVATYRVYPDGHLEVA